MLSPGYLVEPDAMSLDHILKVAQQILGMSTTFMFYMDDTAMYVQQVFHGTADHVHLESGAIAPIDTTYCQFVYRSGQALRVNDSASDTLFRELKTTKDIGIGSYVGVPLITHDGTIIGTLCGLNPIKSAITDEQLALLQILSHALMSGLERINLLNKFKEEHELLQQSHYDGLTNLLNRSAFDTSLQRAFTEAATNTQFLSLLFIDIDHFKKFNDTYGHDIGDIVLKVVANCITTSLRTSDVAFRYGGEEMVVILPCTDAPNAIQVATRILQAVEVPFPEEFLTISGQHVTVSIGACTYPTTASSKESLLKNADTAMYASKEMGRNRCTHTLNIGATHSLYLKSA